MPKPIHGRKALPAWRKLHGYSQAEVGRRVAPPVTPAAVTRWEDDTDARPALATAVQLQNLSGGKVRATSWGYPKEEVAAVLGVNPDDVDTLPPASPEPSPADTRPSQVA